MTAADEMEPTASGSPAADRIRRAAGKAVVALVSCAFCGGRGRDPFGIMSPLATCQVCGGSGKRPLQRPTARCAFCHGTGVHPGSRMTCTSCRGVGTVEVLAGAVRCSSCGGTGKATRDGNYIWLDSPLPCFWCGGKGVVAPER